MPSSESNSECSENKQGPWRYIEERFGVESSDLEGFKILKRSGDFWLCSEDLETDLNTETEGFRFVRNTGRGLKPTTYGLQFLGGLIKKNIVELEEDELRDLLKRRRMIDRKCFDKEGYVALKYRCDIIGCGYYKNETVSSRVPKGRGEELADILDQ